MYEKSFNVRKGNADKSAIYWVQNGAQANGPDSAKRNNLKKDAGYTLTSTPVFYDPARDPARASTGSTPSFDAKEMFESLGLDSESIKKIEFHGLEESSVDQIKEIMSQIVNEKKDDANIDGLKILVNLPKEWMKRIEKLPSKAH